MSNLILRVRANPNNSTTKVLQRVEDVSPVGCIARGESGPPDRAVTGWKEVSVQRMVLGTGFKGKETRLRKLWVRRNSSGIWVR
jgi:hypothetical protein